MGKDNYGCDKLKPSYTFYVYGDISPDEEKIVSEHLTICQECADKVNSLRETLNLLQMKPEPTIPQYLVENFESKMYRRMAMESLEDMPRKEQQEPALSNVILNGVKDLSKGLLADLFTPRRLVIQSAAAVVLLIVGITIGSLREVEQTAHEFSSINTQPTKEVYSNSYPSAHTRIEQYAQKELDLQWEDALLTRYVEGDDWDAASQFKRLIEENPGTSMASMADNELSKTDVSLSYECHPERSRRVQDDIVEH